MRETARAIAGVFAAGWLTTVLAGCASMPGSPGLADGGGFPGAGGPASAADLARKWGPIIPGAHFHHVRMNVLNREASLAFYTSRLTGVKARYGDGQDALWTQRSWILFNEVKTPAPLEAGTAVEHFGWGSPDAPAEFKRQKALGTPFETEMRDISVGLGGKPGQFFFMYLRGPDGEIIEVNTRTDTNFGHIHMESADPMAAAAWYRNLFGTVEAPPYFADEVVQTGAGKTARIFFDNINMIIVPSRNPAIRSTLGSVIDSIGVAVPNLDAAMAAARAHNIKVLAEPVAGPGAGDRHAMIEGPDKLAIELIEDHGGHPPVTNALIPIAANH